MFTRMGAESMSCEGVSRDGRGQRFLLILQRLQLLRLLTDQRKRYSRDLPETFSETVRTAQGRPGTVVLIVTTELPT